MSKKITFTFIVFVALFLTIIGKAFYIQVVNRSRLLSYAKSQAIKKETIHPKRANIFDRNGSPLAINVPAYDLFIMPQNEEMTADGIKKLVEIVPKLDYDNIRKKVITRKTFTWIARKLRLSQEDFEELKKIKGLNIDETVKRYYPNEELLSQVVGFVGIDNKGLAGLEYSLDKQLRGKKKVVTYYKDAKGRPIRHETQEFEQKTEDIYLSIEKDVQIILEQALKEGVEKHKADLGGAAVLDAQTGEIIAVANYPTYNPNKISGSRVQDRKLSFVTNPFEPGSTMKLLTVASALSAQTAGPESIYYCEKGKFSIGKHPIREADTTKKHEWLSVSDIVKYSSNIGTTKIAFDLGYQNLKKTLEDFKVDKKTGIELPAESNGIFTDKEKVSKIKLSNISFGQGIATTGIQMLSAYGAIANGGYYVNPTILKRSVAPQGEKILDKEVVSQLQDMLIKAVNEGTGKNARIKNFDIGGKTSTAQRVSSKGGYEGYIPGFLGMSFNTEKPYVVYVYVDNPQENGYYGSSVAAPVFKKIMEYLLFKNSKKYKEENVNLDRKIAKSSKPKRKVKKGFVPNLLGLDRQSLEEYSQKLGIDIDIEGFGLVFEQFPKAGEVLKSTTIEVKLSPPSYD